MSDKRKHAVLIVDDSKFNIDYLAYILMPYYTVLVAKDGRTAIEVARTQAPDLILLDLIMPEINGFEVLVELKASDLTRRIPVIFITGRVNAEDEEKGFSLGAVDYITKPFINSTVLARIRTQLQMVEYIREIERLGMTDALTNIDNRRSFDIRLHAEWNRAIREKTNISVLMIDVDKFKEYNDKYGHALGDEMLKMIASVFRRILKRTADFASRWGGDEFAILLPNTDYKGALEVGELLRSNVERDTSLIHKSGDDEALVKVSISIGVNSEKPVVGSSVDKFLSRADKALYLSKEAGGNCVRPFI